MSRERKFRTLQQIEGSAGFNELVVLELYELFNINRDNYDLDILDDFTGNKDVNGREIFENDITMIGDGMHSGQIKRVVFDNGKFLYCSHPEGIEVIGNIHKNEDLLK